MVNCKACNFGKSCNEHKNKFGMYKCGSQPLKYSSFGTNCHSEHKNKFGMYKCGSQPLKYSSFGTNCRPEHKNKFGMYKCGSQPLKYSSFGTNCLPEHKNKFGMYKCGSQPLKYSSFGTNCHPEHKNKFGVKSINIKGYSGLTKKVLQSFMIMHNQDVDMSGTKDVLFKELRKLYPNITPSEIRGSVNSGISYPAMKEAKKLAIKKEKEEKERIKLEGIRKVLYTPREQQEVIFKVKRMPGGSKITRTKNRVSITEMDDLADMFSSASASSDPTIDLFSKLKMSFGG